MGKAFKVGKRPRSDHYVAQKVRCKGKTSSGAQCKKWALIGLDVCTTHGGGTRASVEKSNQARQAARQNLAAQAVLRRLGSFDPDSPVNPSDALLDMVRQSAHNVEALRMMVADLELRVGKMGDDTVFREEMEYRHDEATQHVPAAVHIAVVAYNEERDRLARVSKMAIDAGIEERRVRLAELQAKTLLEALAGAMDDCSLLTKEARSEITANLAQRLRQIGRGA